MWGLLERYYELYLHNKLLLYKQILKPGWTYGVQVWGKLMCKLYNPSKTKYFRASPTIIRNGNLHKELKSATVTEELNGSRKKHEIETPFELV